MDKFPEAFERYEDKIETKDIKTFNQLQVSFKQWAKSKGTMTKKQRRALAIEGKEKLKIAPAEKVRIVYEEKKISYYRKDKLIEYIRKAKIVEMTRDVITGRFMKAIEEEE